MLQKEDLKAGTVVEQDGEKMKLLEHSPSWRDDDIPFCVGSIGDDKQITHAKQRWRVDIDGFITHRYIEYFYKIGHVSANCDAWTRLNTVNTEKG